MLLCMFVCKTHSHLCPVLHLIYIMMSYSASVWKQGNTNSRITNFPFLTHSCGMSIWYDGEGESVR